MTPLGRVRPRSPWRYRYWLLALLLVGGEIPVVVVGILLFT
ncbi:hypothetical protein [Halorubrum pallidum]|uniref:Sensor histidine kinase n=1 Tax=Halorubrum pallidum TaxID=1526114 RepID=A0ABD5SZD9_9EURY